MIVAFLFVRETLLTTALFFFFAVMQRLVLCTIKMSLNHCLECRKLKIVL